MLCVFFILSIIIYSKHIKYNASQFIKIVKYINISECVDFGIFMVLVIQSPAR